MQIELVFSKSINWDEFYHFSDIHMYLLGRWSPLLQTPFVYLYFWVPSLPGDSITHIQIIRALILPFELASGGFIFLMARRFASREAALVSTMAYVTGGYVFLHAFALRADMMAAALLSAALWIALCRPLRAIEFAVTGLLLALAFVSTIKSVLYAPAFLGIWLFRLESPGQRRLLLSVAVAGVLAGVALILSAPLLPSTGALGALNKVADLGNSSVDRMFFGGLFPQGRYLLKQVLFAPILSAMIVLAFALALKSKHRIVLLSLLLPLCTVAIYRNAFPYHFAFILPPAMVATAPAAEVLVRRYGLAAISTALLLNAAVLSLAEDRGVLDRQRVIQEGLREIFPRPVVYIDESGMIGPYPRAVRRFASGWALANYQRKGRPDYSEAMQAETVPLLVANSHALRNVFWATGHPDQLLPADIRMLRANYIQHWGLTFVAGKRIEAGTEPAIVSIAVPGPYTVEGQGIEIDGTYHAQDSVVKLDRGTYRVGGERREETVLRWGDHLDRPSFAWPEESIFTDY